MARDVELFAKAMTDVKPLRGRKVGAAATGKAAIPKPTAEEPSGSRERSPAGPAPAERARPKPIEPDLVADARSFDRDVDRALSRGRAQPDGTLDLHGMTLAAAERAVARFLERATGLDWRVALIVTGKGFRREDGRLLDGRIRAEFVGWLNRADNRARVRGVRPAHPRHGGTGAFYVLLRRRSAASKRSLRSTPQR